MRLSNLLTTALLMLLFVSLGMTLGLALYQTGVDPLQSAIMAAAVWISGPFLVYVVKKWEQSVYWLAVLLGALIKIGLPAWLPKAGMAVKSAELLSIWIALAITLIGIFAAFPMAQQIRRWLNVG